jgi:pimeloyl-ACP methyl ester carboxylesterase
MGGKIAMTFACLFPRMVDGLISIDSPPVNRNLYPHLNLESTIMVMILTFNHCFIDR